MNFLKSVLRIIKATFLAIILLCLVVFMTSNRDHISIHLYPIAFDIETRVFVVMIFFFLLGAIFGMFFTSKTTLKMMFQNYLAKRKLNEISKNN